MRHEVLFKALSRLGGAANVGGDAAPARAIRVPRAFHRDARRVNPVRNVRIEKMIGGRHGGEEDTLARV